MAAKPRFSFLAAVSLMSASALAYEILLMRLFSIIQWHHFAFMMISLALLGYGVSGVFLAFRRERLMQNFPAAIIANMLLFSIAAPLCFLLAQQIPFNPAEILWNPAQFTYLCAIYLLLAIPFFFAANVVGLSFYHYREWAAFIYAADLMGAGMGSVAVILLLFLVFPQKILILLSISGSAAALIAAIYGFSERSAVSKIWFSAPLVLLMLFMFAPSDLAALNISPYKGQSQLLLAPGAKIIDRYSSPLGLITVVESGVTPLRHAPGLSLNAATEPPRQLAVFTDADNMTAITRYDGNPETVGYLDQTTSALPYHLIRRSEVLILGAGAGSDILQAGFHGVRHIDAVELNPQVIELVKQKYAEFAGNIYSGPAIDVHLDEARSYLAGTAKSYDLINLSLLDAFGEAGAGLYSLSENYLYTEQSIQEYLRHLNPDGLLSITRWTKIPPRDEAKLLATVISALKQAKAPKPEQQLLMIRGWQTSTLLVKNGMVSADDISRLRQFCNERSYDPVYYPGIAESEVNRFNIQRQPYLYQAAMALLGGDSRAFIDAYKFNIESASDDRPFLFHFFKWRTLPESLSLLGSGGGFLLESGYLLLMAALLQAILASLLLIALPLWLWKSKLGVKPESAGFLFILSYFFCLGLAFLFIEIAFIQKFILILHHPLYAITLVLSSFLLSAGLGGYFSQKLTGNPEKSLILPPIAVIALLSAIYIFSFDSIAAFLLHTGGTSRYMLSIILITPLGFCMGMPFPMALAVLSRTTPALIPWAWGVNGCASVTSAILATLIAMQYGFTVLIFVAIVLYGVAAWCFPRIHCAC
ncbi:MAG: SAM-dependent methyltransferase [Methylomonas sp.]|jgi:spermidine synthase